MSYPDMAEAAKTYALTNAPLVAALTGGIYTLRDLKGKGLSSGNIAVKNTAYNSIGQLKPAMLITLVGAAPSALRHSPTGYRAMRDIMHLWFYQAPEFGFDELYAARALAIAHFDMKTFHAEMFRCEQINRIDDQHEEDFGNAASILVDFAIHYQEYP